MQAALAPRGDARTFLTHFTGSGLDDDRYVIQRYLSRADGDIVPVEVGGARPKGRRKARLAIVSLERLVGPLPAGRTAERRAAGLCPKCGKRRPAPDRSTCEPCAVRSRAAGRPCAGRPAARCRQAAPRPGSGESL